MNQNYLMHHGILGMKWGVRRTPEQLGHRPEGVHEDSYHARSKSAREMSDEELTRSIARVQKEQQYATLTQSQRAKGRAEARRILTTNGERAIATIIGVAVSALATKYIRNKILKPAK